MKLSIVSYLDPASSLKVRAIQRELSNITGSVGSLNSWEPHVTVGDGVEVDDRTLETLKDDITVIAKGTSPFQLTLKGIGSLDTWRGGAGETPYVIYLDIVINNELTKIVEKIEMLTHSYEKWYRMPRPYLPHCTLAFRDLTEDGYNKGLRYIRQIDPEIASTIDHIALVEKLPNIDRELIRFEFGA